MSVLLLRQKKKVTHPAPVFRGGVSSSGPEAVSVVGKAEVLHDSDEGMNLASTRAVTPAVATPCSYSSPNDLIQVRFVSSLLCGVPLPRMSLSDI